MNNYELRRAALTVLGSLFMSAFSVSASTFSSFNVKDFGAVGDGKTDDTHAIQAAILAAEYARKPIIGGPFKAMGSGIGGGAFPEVVLPAGTYRITDTLVCERTTCLRGLEKATIAQQDSSKDIIYFHQIVRIFLSNLNFIGGKTQLQIWTRNLNGALVVASNCTFSNSSAFAVECLSQIRKNISLEDLHKAELMSPYLVTRVDGWPQLAPNPAPDAVEWFNSTMISIQNCHFVNCAGATNIQCDTGVIRDSSVTTADQVGPVFIVFGKIHLYNIHGKVGARPGTSPCWATGDGILSFRDVTVESGDGPGICFFRSMLRPWPRSVLQGHFSLIIKNCAVDVAGSRENALVSFIPGTKPSILSITDCRETSGKMVKAVVWEELPTVESMTKLADVPVTADAPLANQFKIQINGNGENIDPSVPDAIKDFVGLPIPPEVLKEAAVDGLNWNSESLARGVEPTIKAEQFGVTPDPQADSTTALQALFDQARKMGMCRIIFQGGPFLISDTIVLPPNVIVEGAGVPLFLQTSQGKDIFKAPGAEKIAFLQCSFGGGADGVSVSTSPETASRIGFQRCTFYGGRGASVRCLAGGGAVGETSRTELSVQDSTFTNMTQAVVTNAKSSELDTVWVQNYEGLNDSAVIENRGGAMFIRSMLSVPIAWQGEIARRKTPTIPTDWALSNNLRTVDNWGRLAAIDVRFGGEYGGICNVFNRSPNGTIYIEGGLTRFFNDATQKTILFCEEPPRSAVLLDISGLPWPRAGGFQYLGPGAEKGRVFADGVMTPSPPEALSR